MYSQIASQTFHINKYKGEQSERTVREQNTNHRIRNTEYKTQNAIQEATLSAHNKCQWWGGHYKHKTSCRTKISLKTLRAVAKSWGVFRSLLIVVIIVATAVVTVVAPGKTK